MTQNQESKEEKPSAFKCPLEIFHYTTLLF